jgi:hypothetical protein
MRQVTFILPGRDEISHDLLARIVTEIADSEAISGDNIIVHQWDWSETPHADDIALLRSETPTIDSTLRKAIAPIMELYKQCGEERAFIVNVLRKLRGMDGNDSEWWTNAITLICTYSDQERLFGGRFGLKRTVYVMLKSLYENNLV